MRTLAERYEDAVAEYARTTMNETSFAHDLAKAAARFEKERALLVLEAARDASLKNAESRDASVTLGVHIIDSPAHVAFYCKLNAAHDLERVQAERRIAEVEMTMLRTLITAGGRNG